MSILAWTTVDRLADPDSPYAQEAVESASHILWLLSGRKYGGRHSTVETYCTVRNGWGLRDDNPGMLTIANPALWNGEIRNIACGSCGGSCGVNLRLRGTPIVQVSEVLVDGAAQNLDDVLVHDYAEVSPASGCWGPCSEITVSYMYGVAPPASGIHAATELANQYLWAATDDPQCSLPQRVTSVSRQGVSWTLLDQQDFLEQGRTGIYVVDLFLKATNPYNAKMRPRVFSPDIPRARTRRQASTITASRIRSVPSGPT